MPVYEVQDPQGRTLEIDGEHEPTSADLAHIFSQAFPEAPAPSVNPANQYTTGWGYSGMKSIDVGEPGAAFKPSELAHQIAKASTEATILGQLAKHAPVLEPSRQKIEDLTANTLTPGGALLAGTGLVVPPLAAGLGAAASWPAVVEGYKEATDESKTVAERLGGVTQSALGLAGVGLGVIGGIAEAIPRTATELAQAKVIPTELVRETATAPREPTQGLLPPPRGDSGEPARPMPESPLAPRTEGYRITLPAEPETAKLARQVWSKPIDVEAQVEGADALRQLSSMTEEQKTPGQPYQPPTVNVDLRQLEKIMQRNTVSKVESWADETIKRKMRETGANPFLDPEFMAAAATKGAILFKRGVTTIAEWNAAMREQFGRGIDDLLPRIYAQSKAYWESRQPPGEKAAAPESTAPATPPPAEPTPPAAAPPPAEPPPEDLFGIHQDAREALARTGRVPYTPPGQGTTAWEQIQRGRQLMRQGANADEIIKRFESDRRVSADDISVLRAQMENLYQDTAKLKPGTAEYAATQAKLADLWQRSKPMATEWHAIGMAQQGMTDVDLGSLAGMEQAHQRTTGRPFTPEQTTAAQEHATTVNESRNVADKAQTDVLNEIDKTVEAKGKPATPDPKSLDEARKLFDGWNGGPMTLEQVRALWKHAKDTYIGVGESNLDAIAQGVADDFGLPKKAVMDAMAAPKSVRKLTDEMYLKMARARQAQAAARNWLTDQQYPGWLKFLRSIPGGFFSARTFGHGTVGMVTHAGDLMFDPGVAREYWSNFGKQYKLAYNQGYHEAAMQDLMHRPNWATARRAGLANDPFRFMDDYQAQQLAGKGFKTLIGAGQRGFDVLKLLRQDLFDRTWNSLDATQRTSEMAQVVADNVNKTTGYTKSNLGNFQGFANVAFFAPRLEMSRWAFAVGDPMKATGIALRWNNASPSERMFAMQQVKQKARIVGTYLGLLTLNNAMLAGSGSEDRVNFTDPKRSDFLAFKVAGHVVKVIGPMLRMISFLGDMMHISMEKRTKLESLESRSSEAGGAVADYLRSKLSPFGSFVMDQLGQADYQGRPMPWSEDRPKKSLRQRGIDTYGWGEYVLQQAAPIPVEEAIREIWEQQGIRWDVEGKRWLRGIGTGIFTGGTGIRVREETDKEQQSP